MIHLSALPIDVFFWIFFVWPYQYRRFQTQCTQFLYSQSFFKEKLQIADYQFVNLIAEKNKLVVEMKVQFSFWLFCITSKLLIILWYICIFFFFYHFIFIIYFLCHFAFFVGVDRKNWIYFKGGLCYIVNFIALLSLSLLLGLTSWGNLLSSNLVSGPLILCHGLGCPFVQSLLHSHSHSLIQSSAQ